MNDHTFIPQNIMDLWEKLKKENLRGELLKENESLIWKLPNNIIIKVFINHIQTKKGDYFQEGYIGTYYLKNGKKQPMAHWHPYPEEIWKDLMDIQYGETIWVRKTSVFGEHILMMDRKEYEAISQKKKKRYKILE